MTIGCVEKGCVFFFVQTCGLHEENTGLRAHVQQLQAHVQSMTLKIFEVTAKYEVSTLCVLFITLI